VSFESLLIHRVKVHHRAPATTEDRYGNRPMIAGEVDDPIPARIEVPDASENLDDQDRQRQALLVFLGPFNADGTPLVLTGSDALEWLDVDWLLELEGDPLPLFDGVGLHHFETFAYRVTG